MSKEKFELDDEQLSQVTGGEVIIQEGKKRVVFTTRGTYSTFKNNATGKQIEDEVDKLLAQNPNLSEAEFDELARNHLKGLGVI